MSDALDAGAPRSPRGRGLVLVGYRGSGKTTIAQIVARRLDRPFADADRVLEGESGRTVAMLIAEQGWDAFRDAEEHTISRLTAEDSGLVLATGGGAILRDRNRDRMRRLGAVAWLSAPPNVLVERLRSDRANERPALTSAGFLEEVSSVLAEREPLYRATADFIADAADPDPEAVADSVIRQWTEWRDTQGPNR